MRKIGELYVLIWLIIIFDKTTTNITRSIMIFNLSVYLLLCNPFRYFPVHLLESFPCFSFVLTSFLTIFLRPVVLQYFLKYFDSSCCQMAWVGTYVENIHAYECKSFYDYILKNIIYYNMYYLLRDKSIHRHRDEPKTY